MANIKKIYERDIHKAVMSYIRLQKLGHICIHIPNEGKRSPREGALLKAMGMRKGATDLLIFRANHGYHGAFVEIKTPTGKPTQHQLDFIEDANKEGYFATITYGLDETLDILKWYLNLT